MSNTFEFMGAAVTDVGLRRSSNQDSYLYSEELGLYVVADGMGGHSGGETASRIAVETLERFYRERAEQPPNRDPLEEVEVLREAVETANRAIYEHAQAHVELRGMGTTLVALRVLGQTGFVAHVGDSRLYRMDGAGLKRVTKDHSRVQELIDAKQLTEVEAQSILGRNIITRALGNRPSVEVDTQILDMRAEEGYLLCSDGLCGVLNDDETFRICRMVKPPEPLPLVHALIDRVKQSGAPDNVTVLLLLGLRFGEGRFKGPELESFDLYPDTQKILGLEARERAAQAAAGASAAGAPADLDEEKEETKPVVLAQVENFDPGQAILHRGTAEAMVLLETLVKNVAAHHGLTTGDNGSSAAAGEAGEAGLDDQDSTLKMSVSQIQQARAVATRVSPEAETIRMAKPAIAAPAASVPVAAAASPGRIDRLDESPPAEMVAAAPAYRGPESSAAPAGRRPWLLPVLMVLVLLALLAGFLLFAPAQSEHLVARWRPGDKAIEVHQVGLPFSPELGRSLLAGVLGGPLIALRSTEEARLTLPEEVPAEVWEELGNCENCAALGAGHRLVESTTASIATFATQLYASLGNYYRDREQFERARQFYSSGEQSVGAAELKVGLARTHYIEGIHLEGRKDWAGAMQSYERALELGGVEPDLKERLAAVAFAQGKALLEAGKLEEARQALRVADKNGFPRNELQRLFGELERASASGGGTEPEAVGTPAPQEDPKLEIAPPALPDLVPSQEEGQESKAAEAPTAPADKEIIGDPFAAPSSPKPKPQRKPGKKELPVVEYGTVPPTPTPEPGDGGAP